jgi:hypothetical protein
VRLGNILVVAAGLVALSAAVWIAWRGRRLPVYEPREIPSTPTAAASDALRSLAAFTSAGIIAGLLVVGFGGRLFMRVLAVTSGDPAQGKVTEADEIVGAITFDGTLGFLIFAGIVVPVAAALFHLALRHFLPGPVWLGGAILGVILLGTLGVADPLSADNVDFDILEPLWLAVAGISALALLFGVTLAVLATTFDAVVQPLGAGRRHAWTHLPLLFLVLPPFVVVAFMYVVLRVVFHGRTRTVVDGPARKPGMVLVGIGAASAGAASVTAAVSIL